MSRSTLSPTAFRSISTPDGFRRGRRMVMELELPIVDDTAGDPIVFTPAPVAEVEDKWSRLADALESVEKHPLVKKYGFAPCNLVTNVESDHPVAMGFEVLSVTLAACQAVRELADLAGKAEVCKVLGWTDPAPEFLKHFGADRLFKNAGALQARVSELAGDAAPRLSLPTRSTTQKETPMSQTATATRPAPAPSTPTPAPAVRLVPASTPRPEPFASARALCARIEAARAQAARLASPGVTQLLKRARSARTEDQAQRLVADAERMLRVCEATPLPAPRPARAPRAPTPTSPAARRVSHIGKTERERMKKLVKAGKMSREEYTQRTGYYHC